MLSAKPLDDNVLTASGASCSLDAARLNPPIFFFFLTVLYRVSCDEDDDPVFEAGCGSGVLGSLIAEYQSHRLSLQSHLPVDSDRQHGGLHIIWSAGNRGGVCGHRFRSEYLRNALAVTEEGEILSLETVNPFIHTNIYSCVLTVKSCLLRHPLQRQRWISLSCCGWPVGMDGESSITKDHDDYLHTYIHT